MTITSAQPTSGTSTERTSPAPLPHTPPARVLFVCNIDGMASLLLRPLMSAVRGQGYVVHVACACSEFAPSLRALGYVVHHIPIKRKLNPIVNIPAAIGLFKLLRRQHFDLISVHSPIAAAVARLAAFSAGVHAISYTVHGFYFHDNMSHMKRAIFITIERLLGRLTDVFTFVSDEDHQTAVRERIMPQTSRGLTIYGGVDLNRFRPRSYTDVPALRACLGLPCGKRIVGIVGRIVKEKGYCEFLEMAIAVSRALPDTIFLVLGNALPSDRDSFVSEFHGRIRTAAIESRFHFPGFSERIADYLRAMDLFVLPSYREGFPRSIIEAMSCELPVIATDIRGCREAVLHGNTGLIVPPRDAPALTRAVVSLLNSPADGIRMGRAGRSRVEELFTQTEFKARFISALDPLISESVAHRCASNPHLPNGC